MNQGFSLIGCQGIGFIWFVRHNGKHLSVSCKLGSENVARKRPNPAIPSNKEFGLSGTFFKLLELSCQSKTQILENVTVTDCSDVSLKIYFGTSSG